MPYRGASSIWVSGYTSTGFIVSYAHVPISTVVSFSYMAM